ncbi:MAG: Rossmann-like and DUF2520 domain-containing protein [Peptoniphilus sp.]|uniref:Rossmann-like and DUF2520 domain-containing protein n=1 Tax=Peptoniphilus sp. TaxID=1971214 RepID=UPI002A751423|nr:Rossmann-like and DUF2520 domain-containing protein [Peptoniphilus sp.]MDY2986776.1 Rossmann-like and DUF2520 domain-containing protein [Peptoniphilus sp.]
MITIYKVGIIGAGKVGTSLGLYLFKKGNLELSGYYSRNAESSKYSADLTKTLAYESLKKMVDENQILIITVPDDEISRVWKQLLKLNIEDKVVCHCSGSLSSKIFFDSTIKKVNCCSFHPMLAISNKEESYKALSSAFFTLEGDLKAVSIIQDELKLNGNPTKLIYEDDKRKYHLATVFISNLVLALSNISVELLTQYDFTEKEALMALSVLGESNINAFFQKGILKTLTGPVERNDLRTVKGHIDSIKDGNFELEKEIYINLSKYLVEIAKEKNPNRDYSGLKKLLESEGTD